MHFAVADVDKRRDVFAQIKQRVRLDGCLGRSNWRPWKDGQTKVDGCRVQRVDGLFAIGAKRFVDVKIASNYDQPLREARLDAPVAHRVGICEGASGNAAEAPPVIELVALRSEAGFDVPQALAIGQLRKRQTEKLLETRKALGFVPACVSRAAATKSFQRKIARQLRKNQFAGVHGEASAKKVFAGSHRRCSKSKSRPEKTIYSI